MLVFNASAHQDTTRESDDLSSLFALSVVIFQHANKGRKRLRRVSRRAHLFLNDADRFHFLF